jgi:hypothetical protein
MVRETEINNKILIFSGKSMLDDFGRVFFLNGKVYRAIQNSKKSFCLSLINSELFRELLNKDLIPKTRIADLTIDGYELILEHEKLTETLQHEWSFNMLKDATMLVLQVNELCNRYGYELKDAHTLNVLFDGFKPKWVDIGSIVPVNKSQEYNWMAYNEFIGSFVIPLLFWSENNIYLSRKLLESTFYRMELLPAQTILSSNLLSLLKTGILVHELRFRNRILFKTANYSSLIHRVQRVSNRLFNIVLRRNNHQFVSYTSRYVDFNSLKGRLTNLKSPSLSSVWGNYHHKFYANNGQLSDSPRFERIIQLINENANEIKSVVDLAGNQGLLCRRIKEKTGIEKVTLTDYDANSIDVAYNIFKSEKVNDINLLLLNFIFSQDLAGTSKRIKSDLAMALAVSHHLVLTNHYSIEVIMERVKLFSNKYVMIEFMPLGLWAVGSSDYPEVPEWYTESWFQSAFEKHFALIKKEKLEENRVLFFGEIINF